MLDHKDSKALTASRTRSEWLMEQAVVAAQVEAGGADVFKLTLRAPEIARRAVAGQFVMVGCAPADSTAIDPLLRRPFSICEIRPEEGTISLIYRVVGHGTRALAAFGPGVALEVMGPLGHSFPAPAEGRGALVLVGGGLGIPPMVAAAERAVAAGREAQAAGLEPRPVTAIVGARQARYLAGADELRAAGVPVTVMTDDGSAGQQGLVTEPLQQLLDLGAAGEVWACGPEPMLVAVKALCAARSVPCFVSVERHMACGFGACIGCTVPKADGSGYYKTCQDGPVFPAEEVTLGGH